MINEDKVKIDMSYEYVAELSRILFELHQLKMLLVNQPTSIYHLNGRLQALFIKLSSKMTEEEKIKQSILNEKIESIKPIYTKCNPRYSRKVVNMTCIDDRLYSQYKKLCEEREMHLNEVRERLGLTAQQQKKQLRVH